MVGFDLSLPIAFKICGSRDQKITICGLEAIEKSIKTNTFRSLNNLQIDKYKNYTN